MARKRTQAREIAMQLLYQHDVGESGDSEAQRASDENAEQFIRERSDDAEIREFARTLYFGAIDSIDIADELLTDVADKWKVERIARVDRAILRLAIHELNERDDVPARVVLNEAIELAKRYSTAQSGAFINGILDRLLYLRGDSENSVEESDRERS